MRKPPTEKTVTTVEIHTGSATFNVLGQTPLIYNAVSAKAIRQLLSPDGRKTAAEKASTLKHVPIQEFRDSVYRRRDSEDGPTRLILPTRMFKAATVEAAKDMPGATAAQLRRLMWVEGASVDLYGEPQILMSVVRNSDMNRTPDIRTRAIVPAWACQITVSYVQPQLNAETVGKLLAAAGVLNGVGDFRQQKGSGNYGQFGLVGAEDKQFQAIIKMSGMKVQDAALHEPTAYDRETEELLSWFDAKVAKLDRVPAAA